MKWKNRLPVRKQERIINNSLKVYVKNIEKKYKDVDNFKIADALSFIHQNIFQRYISAREVKNKFNFRSADMVAFRKVVGMGVSSYLHNIKMKSAKKLIKIKCLEMYVISFALNYNHEQSFSRAFKNFFGLSPSKFREDRDVCNVV